MKRKSGRRSSRVVADETENNAKESGNDNGDVSIGDEAGSDRDEDFEPEKKKKSNKRKSVSFNAKDDEEPDSQYEVQLRKLEAYC